ncbi:MAG: hypothetical protein ACRCY4_04760, partial [Brevinema sp.]
MKNIILFSFLLFSACGIQAPQAIPRLYPPGALSVQFSSAGGANIYTVTFEGLNSETNFSGYNLYYTADEAAARIGSGTKVVRVSMTTADPTFAIANPF